jgi:hypothetical protein
VARTFTPKGLSLLASSTPMAPNPRIRIYTVHYNMINSMNGIFSLDKYIKEATIYTPLAYCFAK